MSAHRLTDGKLDETDKERNNEQQGKNPPRNLGMKDITNRLAHQDSKVEAPHIEAQILHALHLIHPLRQKLAAQQSQKQRNYQYRGYVSEHHRTHKKKGNICTLLHHREKTRNDNHRKDIGYHRISCQRADASAQLLRHHSHGSCRRTDKTDESTFEHQLGFIIISEFEDKHHHHQCQTGSDELQDKMPSLRFHLLDFNLTEGNIEQGKEHHRHHIHQLRSHRIAQRFQERNIGEDQIAHGSQYQRTGQRKLSKEFPQPHTHTLKKNPLQADCPGQSARGDFSRIHLYISYSLILITTLALQVIENHLAHTHTLRSYLYVLILADVLQTLLKAHHGLWNHASLIIRTGSTHVGQLLCLSYVNHQVVVVNMLTNNLAAVNLLTWVDEELTAILQLIDGVSIGSTCLQRNHATVGTAGNLALVWLILLEAVSHDSLTLRSSEHIGTKTDDTT